MKNKIILGTAQLGLNYGINNSLGMPTEEQAFKILDKAKQVGINYLDTSNAYGKSINVIGKYHRLCGSNFLILSKFKNIQSLDLKAETQKLLEDLRISFLDCLSFHSADDLNDDSYLKVLSDLKSEGLIKKVGISVYTNDELESSARNEMIDVIQLPFNVLDNWTLRGRSITMAKNAGKTIDVRSVYLQGLLLKTVDEYSQFKELPSLLRQINNIANSLNMTIAEFCLSYVFGFPQVDRVLIGVERPEQLQNLVTINAKTLTEEAKNLVHRISVSDSSILDPRTWI